MKQYCDRDKNTKAILFHTAMLFNAKILRKWVKKESKIETKENTKDSINQMRLKKKEESH